MILAQSSQPILAGLSIGSLAGAGFAVTYLLFLATLLIRRLRLNAKGAVASIAGAATAYAPLAVAAKPVTPRKPSIEPGVSPKATALPTDIATLKPDKFVGENAHYLAGWISPNGRYYKVDKNVATLGGHSTLAKNLTGEWDGGPVLEKAGWVHLRLSGRPDVTDPHRLTKAQSRTLMDLCMLCKDSEFARKIMLGIDKDN